VSTTTATWRIPCRSASTRLRTRSAPTTKRPATTSSTTRCSSARTSTPPGTATASGSSTRAIRGHRGRSRSSSRPVPTIRSVRRSAVSSTTRRRCGALRLTRRAAWSTSVT
jgi:hypothetical protein